MLFSLSHPTAASIPVDSRGSVAARELIERDCALEGAVARVHCYHGIVPELVLGQLPTGTHVLVMTHDHAEDLALVDVALRSRHLGSIGLIGSATKWSRFRRRLAQEGHPPEAIEAVTCPIGTELLAGAGKEPAVIAVSVAAALLARLSTQTPAVGFEITGEVVGEAGSR